MDNEKHTADNGAPARKPGFLDRAWDKICRWTDYVVDGVWADQRPSFLVNVVKTINLSVRSFLNTSLQMRASALTYQTLLAIVPALALIFAIGRGFGFQNILATQLFNYFPAQKEALETATTFVDSYLATASEGVFVGIGVVFLLWTLISLISSVEDSFNTVWGIEHGRSFWRKITDYTAIIMILPILMLCSSGITIFMSSTLQTVLPFEFISPLVSTLLDLASWVLTWLFFAGSYMLVPNTKVKFKNAFLAGFIAGTGFTILQWLFVSGQVYVTRYNAIYGSFAFLPLLLIWLQLVWLITLSGAVICYSSQNIFQYSFANEISHISLDYRQKITLSVMTIASRRMALDLPPLTERQLARNFELPIKLVTSAVNRLVDAGLLMRIVLNPKADDEYAYAPAISPSEISLGMVMERLFNNGARDFIPSFSQQFAPVADAVKAIRDQAIEKGRATVLADIPIDVDK